MVNENETEKEKRRRRRNEGELAALAYSEYPAYQLLVSWHVFSHVIILKDAKELTSDMLDTWYSEYLSIGFSIRNCDLQHFIEAALL